MIGRLTAPQILQNFKAGVGQRFYLLFNVAAPTGVSQGYIMLTASQYDSAGYLFTSPTFISLDPTVKPNGIVVKGMRIGINGTIPAVGQAYSTLNTTVTSANYTAQGELLSSVGTVIAIQSGPLTDQFFLSFDQLGTKTHVTTEAAPIPIAPVDLAPGVGGRRAHLRADQLEFVGAYRRSDHQLGGHADLHDGAAAIAL